MNREKPVRITLSIIGRELGILSTLEKKIDKLPDTQTYILNIVESTRDFQIRRSKKIIDEYFVDKKVVKLWKIQRISGIRTEDFKEIRETLKDYTNGRTYH